MTSLSPAAKAVGKRENDVAAGKDKNAGDRKPENGVGPRYIVAERRKKKGKNAEAKEQRDWKKEMGFQESYLLFFNLSNPGMTSRTPAAKAVGKRENDVAAGRNTMARSNIFSTTETTETTATIETFIQKLRT